VSVLARFRRHLARHGEWWWVPALYALAVVWIYRDLWHQYGAPTGLGWDTIDTHGPDLDFFVSELAQGRFSLWNPYDKGGYPVFCDPVFDRYYPFNWPFGLWGAVFGTSWWLVQVKVLAHHVAAAACMHLFLRTRGLSLRAAMVGGLGLVASAPLLVHKASNILWPLVWVPLVWLAIDAALARPSWRRGAGVAAALVLPMTAGSPPGLFYAMLLVAPYAVWRLAGTLREPARRSRPELVRLALCIGVAAGLALLVLALTTLPTRQLVELGSRDRFASGRDFALALSLPFPAAARGVFVRGAGLFEMYMGAALVVLAVCALVVRPRFDRGAPLVLGGLAVLGVVLAAGATGGLLPWLVDHVPGFELLRVPGRYKMLTAWSVAALAGFGIAALEAARVDRALRVRVAVCAALAVVIAIVLVAGWANPASPKERAAWWSIAAVVIAAACVFAAVWTPRRVAEAALGALALCALLDAPLLTFVPPHAPPVADRRQTHAKDAEVVSRLDGVRDRWRVYDEFVLGERAGARLRIRDFRGYPAVDPLSMKRYVEVLDHAKRDAAILGDFNVRWLLKAPHFRFGHTASFVSVPHPGFEARGGGLWEARHPAPLVAWLGAIEVVERGQVLEAMRAAQDADGVRRRAIVEPSELGKLPAGAIAGAPDAREGTLLGYEPDTIRFTIEAPRAGLVVLNELMFPGWKVEIDGRPATPVRANHLMRAVWVEPGHHTITWRFDPPRWRLLVGGYLAALAIMLAAAVTRRSRGRGG
jgi:hypothetical protein